MIDVLCTAIVCGMVLAVDALFSRTGWQAGVPEYSSPSSSVHTSEGELDEDLCSDRGAPQTTDTTQSAQQARRDSGMGRGREGGGGYAVLSQMIKKSICFT